MVRCALLALSLLLVSVVRAAQAPLCDQAHHSMIAGAVFGPDREGAEPVSLKTISKDVLEDLEDLCWIAKPSKDRLIDIEGRPLSRERYDSLLAPFDARKQELS